MAESLAWMIPAALAAMGAAVWLVWYARRHGGRALPPPTGLVTEPPYDWTPTQVGLLMNWGELTPRDLIASMLDLIERRALLLTVESDGPHGERCIIERAPSYLHEVTPSERFLIDGVLLCQPGLETRAALHDVIEEGSRHYLATCRRCDRWCELAAKEQLPMPLEGAETERARGRATVMALALLGAAMPIAGIMRVLGASPLLVLILVLPLLVFGGSFLIASRKVHKATDEAAVARALWEAYREHLTGVPGLAARPLSYFVEGGRPLIYAVTFGLARSLIEDLQLLYPDWQVRGMSPRL